MFSWGVLMYMKAWGIPYRKGRTGLLIVLPCSAWDPVAYSSRWLSGTPARKSKVAQVSRNISEMARASEWARGFRAPEISWKSFSRLPSGGRSHSCKCRLAGSQAARWEALWLWQRVCLWLPLASDRYIVLPKSFHLPDFFKRTGRKENSNPGGRKAAVTHLKSSSRGLAPPKYLFGVKGFATAKKVAVIWDFKLLFRSRSFQEADGTRETSDVRTVP